MRRVCIIVAIALLALLLTGLLGAAFEVLLLVMAALLIALPLRTGAKWLSRRAHWPEGVALQVFTLLAVSILTGIIWILSAKIGDQVTKLIELAPGAFRHFRDSMDRTIRDGGNASSNSTSLPKNCWVEPVCCAGCQACFPPRSAG